MLINWSTNLTMNMNYVYKMLSKFYFLFYIKNELMFYNINYEFYYLKVNIKKKYTDLNKKY